MSFLLVSPCLCKYNYGGVQLSGRIVRDRFLREKGEPGFACLCYGVSEGIEHDPECTASKLELARRARRFRTGCENLLFWHLGMLKLLPLLRRRHTRVYLFLHGVECWRTLDPITQHLLKSVDVFLVNSTFTWRRFTEENPRWTNSRHRIVSLGMGTPDTLLQASAQIPAALMVGRLDRGEGYKGHREVIQAWPLVLQRVPAAELWIAGTGNLEADLKRIVHETGMERRVRFFGKVSEEEKERLIGDARCLVLPSKGEGFGLAYLEAMRCGRPCLTGNMDAGREVVNPPEGGLAVDPDDSNGLSEAIVRLLTAGHEWQQWSATAQARYESQFTSQHFEDRLLAAVDEAPNAQ